MEQEACIPQFLKRRVKRRYEILWEVANETDRIGDDDFAFAGEAESPRNRVKRREHLVFDMHIALRKTFEKRALARIRVSHDREHGYATPVALAPSACALLR